MKRGCHVSKTYALGRLVLCCCAASLWWGAAAVSSTSATTTSPHCPGTYRGGPGLEIGTIVLRANGDIAFMKPPSAPSNSSPDGEIAVVPSTLIVVLGRGNRPSSSNPAVLTHLARWPVRVQWPSRLRGKRGVTFQARQEGCAVLRTIRFARVITAARPQA
jgi:hypothetical protein